MLKNNILESAIRKTILLYILLLLVITCNRITVKAEEIPELSIQIGTDSNLENYSYTDIKDKNSVTLKQKYTYQKTAIKPQIKLQYKENSSSEAKVVSENQYTVAYTNNINAGTASIKVTFDNKASDYETWKKAQDFADQKTFSFMIEPKDVNSTDITYKIVKNPVFKGGKIELTSSNIEVYDGKTLIKKGTDYSVGNYQNSNYAGTATATIFGNDSARVAANPTKGYSGNYTGRLNFNFVIYPKNIADADVTTSTTTRRYTGSALPTSIKMICGSYTLVSGVDYTVEYSNNINVGSAVVTIHGKGNFTGLQTENFKIVPAPTTLTQLVRAGSKKIKVGWNAQTVNVSGYQIMYSRSSKFTGSTTKKVTASKTAKSKKISKLKAKKTYYVKVRIYKKVGGINYYSAWSNVRKIKVK